MTADAMQQPEELSDLWWWQFHGPRPLMFDRFVSLIRIFSADGRTPLIVLETRVTGRSMVHLIGCPEALHRSVAHVVSQLLPGVILTEAAPRHPVAKVGQVRASTRYRAVRVDDPIPTVRAVRGALMGLRLEETAVVQLILGRGLAPLAVPTRISASAAQPWYRTAWFGSTATLDSEPRARLREKVGDHGFACTLRIGVDAADAGRRRSLGLDLLAALRTSETPGLRLRVRRTSPRALNRATRPWRHRLRLNSSEVASLSAFPIGEEDLPGLGALHPRLLPPAPGTTERGVTLAVATAPGVTADLKLDTQGALRHVHVVAPTGAGKSVLLGRLIEQYMALGFSVVVVDPKGDLVEDSLAHVPFVRRSDVVELDPNDPAPVGLNPLTARGRRPEVVADVLLSIFRHLYGDAIGPRSGDILYAATLTLARRSDASLVMLPLILTNPGFRRSLIKDLHDPIALEPFWAAFNAWSDGERNQAISPLMNKLRPMIIRPSLRAVLGQIEPRFSLRDVFTERKLLFVPLREGIIGTEAASLLGSLLVSELWQATQERAAVPPAERHPVMIIIDEIQNYLHIGSTDLGDALAQARGYGVGFHLAHQYLGQLDNNMLRAIRSNARSTIVFQSTPADAVELAKGHPELEPADLTALGQYEVYASLFSNGQVTPYASGRTMAPSKGSSNPDMLRRLSRARYGRPLADIEAGWAALLEDSGDEAGPVGRRRRGGTL